MTTVPVLPVSSGNYQDLSGYPVSTRSTIKDAMNLSAKKNLTSEKKQEYIAFFQK